MRNELFEWRSAEPRGVGKDWSSKMLAHAAASVFQECLDNSYRVDCLPDEVERTKEEVDVLLKADGLPSIAIEITRLESFSKQLKNRSLFLRHFEPAGRALSRELPLAGIRCILPAAPFSEPARWPEVVERITDHIRTVWDSLEPGGTFQEVAGVPFGFWLGREPESGMRFSFERESPPHEQIVEEIVDSMRQAVGHKRERLREYRAAGSLAALAITSSDPYLLAWPRAYETFRLVAADGDADHLDYVVYALTTDYHNIYFMGFKGERAFLDALNYRNVGFDPILND